MDNNLYNEEVDFEEITDQVDSEESPFKDVDGEQPQHIFDKEDTESYDDVLQLTEYSDGMLTSSKDSYGVVAEYNEISIESIDKTYEIQAKNFVGKITKFIYDFDDVQLTDRHKKYLAEVGKLQMSNLQDMLVLVDMNKQMLQNVLHRVNATQAEDYAIIESYNKLLNQQLKLMKELQATYKSIPATMKKMRNDVFLNETTGDAQSQVPEPVITEEFGESQFNNGKQLLRHLREKVENEKLNEKKFKGEPINPIS